jgi:hypothetical protein
MAQLADASNNRTGKFAVVRDSLQLDSLSIIPLSIHVEGVDTAAFFIDYANNVLRWKQRPIVDSVRIDYKVFPINFSKRYYHKNVRLIEQSFAATPFYYDAIQANTNGVFIDFGNVDYTGSFGRALSFGNNQNVVLNSQFPLCV